VLVQPFAVDDRTAFREMLAAAYQVLYLTDNAGETVFDRVLIEALGVPLVIRLVRVFRLSVSSFRSSMAWKW
jgi:uncharacterized protein with ATP-grasp and redox domains